MFRSDSLFLYFMAGVCACSPAWGNSKSDILPYLPISLFYFFLELHFTVIQEFLTYKDEAVALLISTPISLSLRADR